MALQLHSGKPGISQGAVKRSFWRIPVSFFGHRQSAYRALKDVDSPVKRKSSSDNTEENTEETLLLKTGSPTTAKYAEKLSRHAGAEEKELYVPRPNSRITFKLPDNASMQDMHVDHMHVQTAATDSNGQDMSISISNTDVLIPANELLPAADISAATSGEISAHGMAPGHGTIPADASPDAIETLTQDEC